MFRKDLLYPFNFMFFFFCVKHFRILLDKILVRTIISLAQGFVYQSASANLALEYTLDFIACGFCAVLLKWT